MKKEKLEEQDESVDYRDAFLLYANTGSKMRISDIPHFLWNIGKNPSKKEISELTSSASKLDNSGSIEYQNLMKLLNKNIMKNNVEDILQAFKIFDYDNSGKISINVFRDILKKSGEKFDDSEFEKVMVEIGENSGYLNYMEFYNQIQKEV
ncbi:hypothetical protein A3Q56_03925 [Intoshia linei]|uniref:EF-hand domain-containing protein n=1 Tax=Intoshia linei TaxID=1819745 RepID=A0A177B234_9BILA|nr:hypothetical protein A3Q56_03925 [Intoshia linei]